MKLTIVEQQKAVAMTALFFHSCTRTFKCNILQSFLGKYYY